MPKTEYAKLKLLPWQERCSQCGHGMDPEPYTPPAGFDRRLRRFHCTVCHIRLYVIIDNPRKLKGIDDKVGVSKN